jgi:hypothetical protein
MRADGVDYQISFNPRTQSTEAAARNFCIRNAAAFEITTEDQLPSCVGPVSNHLQRELNAAGSAARPPARRQPEDRVTVSELKSTTTVHLCVLCMRRAHNFARRTISFFLTS